ncbi:hypothetical protein LOK49_LG08G00304 [Camellia lanceoleosa]|uniref:Uncharacterized protein n=1 Tax=Camellia lanceoleosa TaxID=1840588 RepID=A0ACC0GSC1_9ERIC|nr:hypothetical protein LOK49_LG08G00304 [Camellia lanceoleosa]
MSTTTSSWPPRMCACGFGHCIVKISRSAKNLGRAYYICPIRTMNNRCAKFKTKPLEHLDLMEWVYSDAVATGKHAWAPTKVRDDTAAVANANEDNKMRPFSVGTPPQPGHDTIGRTWWRIPFSTMLPRS